MVCAIPNICMSDSLIRKRERERKRGKVTKGTFGGRKTKGETQLIRNRFLNPKWDPFHKHFGSGAQDSILSNGSSVGTFGPKFIHSFIPQTSGELICLLSIETKKRPKVCISVRDKGIFIPDERNYYYCYWCKPAKTITHFSIFTHIRPTIISLKLFIKLM